MHGIIQWLRSNADLQESQTHGNSRSRKDCCNRSQHKSRLSKEIGKLEKKDGKNKKPTTLRQQQQQQTISIQNVKQDRKATEWMNQKALPRRTTIGRDNSYTAATSAATAATVKSCFSSIFNGNEVLSYFFVLLYCSQEIIFFFS